MTQPRDTLLRAATQKDVPQDQVLDALLKWEQSMKTAAKSQQDLAQNTLAQLDGEWRLIFTTGTVNTQKRIGKINYFPLKAVQTFDTASMKLTNGIYLGDLSIIKFFGPFEWDNKKRRLDFDFENVQLFGIRFNIPKGQEGRNKSAFFNWISADEQIATARGGGGGLALWSRI